MTTKVQKLCRLSHKIFSSFPPKNKLETNDVLRIKKYLEEISLEDIYFDVNDLDLSNNENINNQDISLNTYTSIFQNQFFSLTVFGFRDRSACIPLHDHPNMHGFIKCVMGCIAINSYNLLNPVLHEIPSRILDKIPITEHHNLVPSKYLDITFLREDERCVATLTPNEGNIHEIKSLNCRSVMVDVIAPPYTEYTRSYYYTVVDTVFDPKHQQNITWLLKSLHNSNYRCDTLFYKGPSIIV